jgi:GT2 family glycosyltransferase
MMITVVIPTCERPDCVVRCLDKINGADEVIVTDDSKTDQTRQVIRDRFPRVRWVRGPGRGPAANRNFGARHATSDLLAFVDDDCIPADDWVGNMRKALADGEVVEGKTICTGKTEHPLEEVVENPGGGLLWSCNFGIRAELFWSLGGFDEDFLEAGGEDLELAWRLKRNGITPIFAPAALVYHPARRVTMGRWVYRLFQDRWHLLCRLKSTPARSAAFAECIDLVRTTSRLLRGRLRDQYPARLLSVGARWVLFPVWVVYLICWESRFRQILSRRTPSIQRLAQRR